MKKHLKLIVYFLFITCIIVFLGIFIFKNGYLFKYKPSIILSGSMEPALSVDDLVFTKKAEEIKVGDIVTFYDDNGNRVMHRVVEIKDDSIITKGDANNTLDKSITKDQVEGIYVGKIKYVGKIFKFIKSPIGLLTSLLLVGIVLFFPNIKNGKKAFGNNENEKMKMMLMGIIYVVSLSGCMIAGYYSKYQKELMGNDNTAVASWSNNIELLSNDTLHFQNGKKDTNIINFNLIYESEVAAQYDISINNISKKLGIELSNDETGLSIKQSNNSFVVDFNNNTVSFDIDQLRTDHLISLNAIEATYEYKNDKDVYTFKDTTTNQIIRVVMDIDNFNLTFINFGDFQVDDPNSKPFTLKVSAIEAELPNLDNLELYATFEQID